MSKEQPKFFLENFIDKHIFKIFIQSSVVNSSINPFIDPTNFDQVNVKLQFLFDKIDKDRLLSL